MQNFVNKCTVSHMLQKKFSVLTSRYKQGRSLWHFKERNVETSDCFRFSWRLSLVRQLSLDLRVGGKLCSPYLVRPLKKLLLNLHHFTDFVIISLTWLTNFDVLMVLYFGQSSFQHGTFDTRSLKEFSSLLTLNRNNRESLNMYGDFQIEVFFIQWGNCSMPLYFLN